ncbi:zinc finger, CCHC-type containing protein [Tanacetum coccineum]|uniref:Zinc finger, CCHC-type containing protein n=1 Tax=Tanacetum coccineum TaxID=301880 RepID=A0ABQ5EWI7_9ASTR
MVLDLCLEQEQTLGFIHGGYSCKPCIGFEGVDFRDRRRRGHFLLSGHEDGVCADTPILEVWNCLNLPKNYWILGWQIRAEDASSKIVPSNKCVYSKFDESGKEVIIYLYVDDMLIFGTDQVQVDLTKKNLSSRFSMKDMGRGADVILGIRIKHGSNGIAISQSYYIKKVLKKSNYFDCTPVSTPMDISEKLMPNNGQDVSQLEFLGTASNSAGTEVLEENRGWLLVRKAECVATLAKAYSQMYNGKSRHLSVRHSMIRELITNGMVSIEFVRSQQNLADHLTNGLDRDLVIKSAKGMRLKSN